MTGFASADVAQLSTELGDAARAIADTEAVDDQALQLIVDAASPFTPRRTGALAAGSRVVAGTIVNAASYAAPVHWGWERGGTVVAAQPFLVRGTEAAQAKVEAAFEDHITTSLDRTMT